MAIQPMHSERATYFLALIEASDKKVIWIATVDKAINAALLKLVLEYYIKYFDNFCVF